MSSFTHLCDSDIVDWRSGSVGIECAIIGSGSHSCAIWLNASFYLIFNMWNYWQSIKQCKRHTHTHTHTETQRDAATRRDSTRLDIQIVGQPAFQLALAAIAICHKVYAECRSGQYQNSNINIYAAIMQIKFKSKAKANECRVDWSQAIALAMTKWYCHLPWRGACGVVSRKCGV